MKSIPVEWSYRETIELLLERRILFCLHDLLMNGSLNVGPMIRVHGFPFMSISSSKMLSMPKRVDSFLTTLFTKWSLHSKREQESKKVCMMDYQN